MELYKIIEFFKEKFGNKLLAIVLFGSTVYKGYGKDIDLLIIVKDIRNIFEESVNVSIELSKRYNYKIKFDCWVLDSKTFLENLKVGTFLTGLALGYKVLYDKINVEKYIKEFLKEVSKSNYKFVKKEEFDLRKYASIRL